MSKTSSTDLNLGASLSATAGGPKHNTGPKSSPKGKGKGAKRPSGKKNSTKTAHELPKGGEEASKLLLDVVQNDEKQTGGGEKPDPPKLCWTCGFDHKQESYENWCQNTLDISTRPVNANQCRKSPREIYQCDIIASPGYQELYGAGGPEMQASMGENCACTTFIQKMLKAYDTGQSSMYSGGRWRFVRLAMASPRIARSADWDVHQGEMNALPWYRKASHFTVLEHCVGPRIDGGQRDHMKWHGEENIAVAYLIMTVLCEGLDRYFPTYSGILNVLLGLLVWAFLLNFYSAKQTCWLLLFPHNYRLFRVVSYSLQALMVVRHFSKNCAFYGPKTIIHHYDLLQVEGNVEDVWAPQVDRRNRTNNYAKDPLDPKYKYVEYRRTYEKGWVYSTTRESQYGWDVYGANFDVFRFWFHTYVMRPWFDSSDRGSNASHEKFKALIAAARNSTHTGSGKLDMEDGRHLISQELFDQILNSSVQSYLCTRGTLENRIDQRALNSTCVNISSRLGFTMVSGNTSRLVLAYVLSRRQANGLVRDHVLYDPAQIDYV